VLHTYGQLLRKELACDNDELCHFVCEFHTEIALKLFNFVRYSKITHEQLLCVMYYILQLTSSRKKGEEQVELIRSNLKRVREMFQAMFIEEEYTYDMEQG